LWSLFIVIRYKEFLAPNLGHVSQSTDEHLTSGRTVRRFFGMCHIWNRAFATVNAVADSGFGFAARTVFLAMSVRSALDSHNHCRFLLFVYSSRLNAGNHKYVEALLISSHCGHTDVCDQLRDAWINC